MFVCHEILFLCCPSYARTVVELRELLRCYLQDTHDSVTLITGDKQTFAGDGVPLVASRQARLCTRRHPVDAGDARAGIDFDSFAHAGHHQLGGRPQGRRHKVWLPRTPATGECLTCR